jgi:hypothetical protein
MKQTTLRTRTGILMGISAIIVILLVVLFFYLKKQFFETRTQLTEDVMVEKITNMGKLELVKYSMKDVLEKKEIRRFLPDQRILFVAVGEVAGCIDLTKVKKEDIRSSGDSLTITLPTPEICYTRLDHQRSKVYDVSGAWFPSDAKDMVEDIYKIAEKKIHDSAIEMDVLGKTRQNAELIFKPMLENISGKRVGIVFK